MILINNYFFYNIKTIYTFDILNDIFFIIPELFQFLSLILIIFYGSFYSNFNIYKYTKLSWSILNLISLSIILNIILLLNNKCYENIISSYLLYNDGYILLFKIILSSLTLLIMYISYEYLLVKNIKNFEIYIFIYISFISLILLIMSYDFILTYLTIELQGLCSFVLVALNKSSNNKSIEASLKYFVLGSFASSMLLLGISFVYWSTGMTNFKDISDLMQLNFTYNIHSNFFILGLILIHIGIFFKLSVAPFHLWLPDVFYGASKVIVLVFSILPKISIALLLFKLNYLFFININFIESSYLYIYFILASLLFGINGALKAEKLNKLIAYSSISHMGFLLSSIINYNFYVFLIYIIIYSFILLSIFVVFFNLINPVSGKSVDSLNKLIYFKKTNYILFVSLVVSFFSISGIPPLSGFFSKFIIFINLINENYILLTVILLLLSVVSCFYYLRIIKIISFNNNKKWFFIKPINKLLSYIISILIIINSFLFLLLPFLFEVIEFLEFI